MRLTIICADKAVYKDGVAYTKLSMTNVPNNVHALQWFETEGWIEFTDNSPNQPITSLPEWANTCVDEWNAADYNEKNPPAPTEEELLQQCRDEALQKLRNTDYSELIDVKAVLLNSEEFVLYRAKIRTLYINPVTNPVWPATPKAQWSE